MYARMIYFLIALLLLMPSAALAHIVNENSLYEDIQYSDAKAQILYLSGLGVIASDHSASLFKPKDKLTRADLAYWAGSFLKLSAASTKVQDIQNAALAKGLVTSLQGNATYEDVNRAYFQGQGKVKQPESELTREDFVLFMADYLRIPVNGQTLFERAGFLKGPAGAVEQITVQEQKDETGKSVQVYSLQLNGKSYSLSAHPKVVNGLTDPTSWKGSSIQEAWLINAEGKEQLQLITFEKREHKDMQAPAPVGGGQQGGLTQAHSGHTPDASSAQLDAKTSFPYVPAIAGLLLIIVAGWLFIKKPSSYRARK
ncbi:hypothetical protein [Paenibacillus radicis (ex Xue et al. 2023)]|uniref:SLH domain-containing protein n=1 Tax=Paenibacillus radicis (ex Xue et al. 2023) TaxID=2972489 RepID=A0ABT1YER8_9BACL|nr:hypothetical protein [Paenibacillus radicis (ex Xue et al. 2023)]MCR8631669.1 hypothetical protein [Paenibacillus radicis (ex Xue et al. 2023)]